MLQTLGRIYDNQRSDSWSTSVRQQRLNLFKSLLKTLPAPIKILDVGGRVSFWENSGFLSEFKDIEITLLNVSVEEVGSGHATIKQVVGDARSMRQFASQQFDAVFSNSVIEHVGEDVDQRQMANEVMRVGQRYFIQTPNLYFPIEPHFLVPGFQFLPVELRARLLAASKLGWYDRATDLQTARETVGSIKLLSKKKLLSLFPSAKLYEEKVMGLTKSLVVYDGWETASPN